MIELTNLNIIKTNHLSSVDTSLTGGLSFDVADDMIYLTLCDKYGNIIKNRVIDKTKTLADSITDIYSMVDVNKLSYDNSIVYDGYKSNSRNQYIPKNKKYTASIFIRRGDYPDCFVIYKYKGTWNNRTQTSIEGVYNLSGDIKNLIGNYLAKFESASDKRSILPTRYSNVFDIKGFNITKGVSGQFTTLQDYNFHNINTNQSKCFKEFYDNKLIQPNIFTFNFYFNDTTDDGFVYKGVFFKEKNSYDVNFDKDYLNSYYRTEVVNDYDFIHNGIIKLSKTDNDIRLVEKITVDDDYVIRDKNNRLHLVTNSGIDNHIKIHEETININDFMGIDTVTPGRLIKVRETYTGDTYSNISLVVNRTSNSPLFNAGDYISIKGKNQDNFFNEWRFIAKRNNEECGCDSNIIFCEHQGKTITFKTSQYYKEAKSIEFVIDKKIYLENGSKIKFKCNNIYSEGTIFRYRSKKNETRFNLYFKELLDTKQDDTFIFEYIEPNYYYRYFDVNLSPNDVMKYIHETIEYGEHGNIPVRSFIINNGILFFAKHNTIDLGKYELVCNFSKKTPIKDFIFNGDIHFKPIDYGIYNTFNFNKIDFSGYSSKGENTVSLLIDKNYSITYDDIISTRFGNFRFTSYDAFGDNVTYTNFFMNGELFNDYKCYLIENGNYPSNVIMNEIILSKKFNPKIYKIEAI